MNKLLRGAVLGAVATSLVLTAVPARSGAVPSETNHHRLPVRGASQEDHGAPGAGAKPSRPGGNGIDYHNGPVMLGTINTYVIWYGTWDTAGTKAAILTNLLSSIGGSPYFGINTGYYDGAGHHISNSVAFAGDTTDTGSQGKSNLSDSAIQSIVASAISGGRLPKDPNGVYFVFTSSDVSKSGFLTQYCGWHTYATISGSNIKYSFVGDPSGPNLSNCAAQTTSPNGDAGADAMASVVAHELEEATTDPNLNAWYDRRGYENADKCAWTFGTTYTVANGSKANMKLGSMDYLIQRNWVNASGGYCALSA